MNPPGKIRCSSNCQLSNISLFLNLSRSSLTYSNNKSIWNMRAFSTCLPKRDISFHGIDHHQWQTDGHRHRNKKRKKEKAKEKKKYYVELYWEADKITSEGLSFSFSPVYKPMISDEYSQYQHSIDSYEVTDRWIDAIFDKITCIFSLSLSLPRSLVFFHCLRIR